MFDKVGTARNNRNTPSDDSSWNTYTLCKPRTSSIYSQGSDGRYVSTKTHAALTAPALQITLEVSATTDNTVLLVRLVKSMREMGCEPYMGEYDAKIAGRWIKKVEKIMV
jgi:hypothetical protein